MNAIRKQIDILNGSLIDKILMFAIPLAITSALQQLFNSCDVIVCGKFVGSLAIAAVGANSSIINLFINLFVGLSIGVNVLISNYIGREKYNRIYNVTHTALTVGLIFGIIFVIFGLLFSRNILEAMGCPSDVIDLAALYLRIYFLGMPFVILYNFGSAILRTIGDTKRPLIILIISGIINVCLNLILVIIFGLGVKGVAIATVTSNVFNCVLVMYLLSKEDSFIKVNFKKPMIDMISIKKILSIGLPAGIQGMVFSISNICIQSAINSLGSKVIAGTAAGVNFENFEYFLISAFSQTIVTFISQNHAAKNYDRCKDIFKWCIILSVSSVMVLTMVFLIFIEPLAYIFTNEVAVVEIIKQRFYIVGLCTILEISFEVVGGAIRGLGHSILPAIMVFFGTVIFRILWVYTAFKMFNTYVSLIAVYPLSWTIIGIASIIVYINISKKELLA